MSETNPKKPYENNQLEILKGLISSNIIKYL